MSEKEKRVKTKKLLNRMIRITTEDYNNTRYEDFDNTDEYENELSYRQGRMEILHELKAILKRGVL